jgi:SAM-dependent methyltransferase
MTVGVDLEPAPVLLRTREGQVLDLPVHRWFAAAGAAEQRALDEAVGPALDIGCGPGRHLVALAEREVFSLGIDISIELLDVARRHGVNVLERSVFDRVPGAGKWRSALLLDGNIGIGGDPIALLTRIGELLAPDGRLFVEIEPFETTDHVVLVRAETPVAAGPWFRWTTVGPRRFATIARTVGFDVVDVWDADDRRFAHLRRR